MSGAAGTSVIIGEMRTIVIDLEMLKPSRQRGSSNVCRVSS